MSERFRVSSVGDRNRSYGSTEDDYDGKNGSEPASRQGSVKSSHSTGGGGGIGGSDDEVEREILKLASTNDEGGGIVNPSMPNGKLTTIFFYH